MRYPHFKPITIFTFCVAQIYLLSNSDKREGKKHALRSRSQKIPLNVAQTVCDTSQNAQKTSRMRLSRLSKFDCIYSQRVPTRSSPLGQSNRQADSRGPYTYHNIINHLNLQCFGQNENTGTVKLLSYYALTRTVARNNRPDQP